MSEELPTELREMALTFATFGSYKAEQRLRDAADAIEGYERENAKLRELARLLLWGVDNDMPRYEELAWTQKVNTLTREMGVEL